MEKILSCMIIIAFFLAIVHFVYDGIIAPSIRFHLKNDLFSLRDRVRRLIIEDDLNDIDKGAARFVDGTISFFIGRLSLLTLSSGYVAQKEIAKNATLKEKTAERLRAIETSQNNDIRDIFEKTNWTMRLAVTANSGMLLFTVCLFVFPLFFAKAMIKKFKALVSKLIMVPPKEAERIFA